MCLWNTNAPVDNKDQIVYFSINVKVSRPLTLVSFEKDSLSMHAKYEVSISYGSKVTWPRLNFSDMLVKGQGH